MRSTRSDRVWAIVVVFSIVIATEIALLSTHGITPLIRIIAQIAAFQQDLPLSANLALSCGANPNRRGPGEEGGIAQTRKIIPLTSSRSAPIRVDPRLNP